MHTPNIFLYVIVGIIGISLIGFSVYSFIFFIDNHNKSIQDLTLEEICSDNNIKLDRIMLNKCYKVLEERLDNMEIENNESTN